MSGPPLRALAAARVAGSFLLLGIIWPALGACSAFLCVVILDALWVHFFSACGLLVGGVLAIRWIERRVWWAQVRREHRALTSCSVLFSFGGIMWGCCWGVGLNDAVDLAFRGVEETSLDAVPALPPAWTSIVDGAVDGDQAVTARWRTEISTKGSGRHYIDYETTLAPVLSAGGAPESARVWACADDVAAFTGPIAGRATPWSGRTGDAYREALQEAGLSAPEDAFCVMVGQGDRASFIDGGLARRREGIRDLLRDLWSADRRLRAAPPSLAAGVARARAARLTGVGQAPRRSPPNHHHPAPMAPR